MKPKSKTLLFLLLLAAVSGLLRVHNLARLSLWIDEGYTVWKIKQPYSEIFHLNRIDTVPPLYYYLLKTWVLVVGEGDYQIRLFSALLGSATCVVIFFVGRLLFDSRAGALSAACMALSSFHIQYSQEARSYALVALLFAVSLYFILKLVNASSWPLWIGYTISGTMLIYSHGIALLYLAALNLFLLSYRSVWNKNTLWKLFLANTTIFLTFSPWFVIYLKQIASFRQQTIIEKPGASQIISTLVLLASFPPPNAAFLPTVTRSSARILLPTVQLGWAVSAGLLFILPLAGLKRRPSPNWNLYWLFCLPFILIVGLSYASQSIYVDRLFVVCVVPFVLLLGSNGERQASMAKKLRAALVFVYLVVSAFCLQTYYFRDWKEDYRGATEYLVTNARPGDLLIFVAHVGELHFDWYSKGRRPDLIKVGLPEGIYERGEPDPGRFVRSSKDLDRLSHLLLKSDQQIWLVQSHTYDFDPHHLTNKWLAECLDEKPSVAFSGIQISRYQLPQSRCGYALQNSNHM